MKEKKEEFFFNGERRTGASRTRQKGLGSQRMSKCTRKTERGEKEPKKNL